MTFKMKIFYQKYACPVKPIAVRIYFVLAVSCLLCYILVCLIHIARVANSVANSSMSKSKFTIRKFKRSLTNNIKENKPFMLFYLIDYCIVYFVGFIGTIAKNAKYKSFDLCLSIFLFLVNTFKCQPIGCFIFQVVILSVTLTA